ncbi:MAG: acyl-CoA/acyl-ACP dehydrogenase [Proteobacteria bacterium]|nr:acyl-CoA/acyl-ACP dehydrogenase [Pseudomonadota bacterium]
MTAPPSTSNPVSAPVSVEVPAKIPDDFGFTDDHALLRDTARRMMVDRCPLSEVRRLAGDPVGFDPDLYRELAELGWTGLLIDEKYGGAGLDTLSMALILEQTGRALLPGPLWSTIMAALAIDSAGSEEQKQRFLPALARGEAIGALAWSEPGGSWQPDGVNATAGKSPDSDGDGAGYLLDGVKTHVLWADRADVVVAPFVIGDELSLFAIETATTGLAIESENSVDPTRRTARVVFDRVRVPEKARLSAGHAGSWRALHVRGYALLAAETLGAADAILALTRDYACERIQFNRPIGAFQAVKHPLVNVLIAVERARSLVAGAVAGLDGPSGAEISPAVEISARMAKAQATEALNFAADRGIQLHGGFGFTWDCDAHWFFKRALWSAATLGDAIHHRRHLAAYLLGR